MNTRVALTLIALVVLAAVSLSGARPISVSDYGRYPAPFIQVEDHATGMPEIASYEELNVLVDADPSQIDNSTFR